MVPNTRRALVALTAASGLTLSGCAQPVETSTVHWASADPRHSDPGPGAPAAKTQGPRPSHGKTRGQSQPVIEGRTEVEPAPYTAPKRKPNIFLITTDDAAPDDLRYMPNVRKLIAAQGTTFTNGIAPTPICVPARASLLTGQYTHNHGALTISGQGGGFAAFDDRNTLPVWLHRAGYDTMFVGKYLNGYGNGRAGRTYVPPGWSDWRGSIDPVTYDFSQAKLSVNGRVRSTQRYNTDVFADNVAAMLKHERRTKKPWYMWVNYVAPHFGGPRDPDDPLVTHPKNKKAPKTPSPAKRHRDKFKHLALPDKPNMFEANTSDKPRTSAARKNAGAYGKTERKLMRELYQQRIESLQAVDEAVGRHIRILKRTGQLSRTIIVFSSDNGYMVGEHNIDGKLWHYRESSTIPMVMRGPGIPRDQRRHVPVTNPDLPVSFAAAAGAEPGRDVDGVNVFAHLDRANQVRVVPLEAYPVRGGRKRIYSGIRVGPWTYVKYHRDGGPEELYNHTDDPHELLSRTGKRYQAQLAELRELNRTYRNCQGTNCPQTFYR